MSSPDRPAPTTADAREFVAPDAVALPACCTPGRTAFLAGLPARDGD